MLSKLKKFKNLTGLAICAGLVAIVIGAVIFFVCLAGNNRETHIEAQGTVKLSTVTGIDDKSDIVLCAHRGLSCDAPENTLAAFIQAGEMQFPYIELDVRETADGVFVVMHDKTIDRMTNGKGYVSDMTLKQLLAFTVDNGANVETNSGQKIPTLAQALDVCAQYGIVPEIELKDIRNQSVQRLLDEIHTSEIEQFIILSFDSELLLEIREKDENARLWLLSDKITDNAIAFCTENQNTALVFNATQKENDAQTIKKAADNSVELACWGVNDAQLLVEMYKNGIRMFTTDTILPLGAVTVDE